MKLHCARTPLIAFLLSSGYLSTKYNHWLILPFKYDSVAHWKNLILFRQKFHWFWQPWHTTDSWPQSPNAFLFLNTSSHCTLLPTKDTPYPRVTSSYIRVFPLALTVAIRTHRVYSPLWGVLVSYCFSFHYILDLINILTFILWITEVVKQVVTSYSCSWHFGFSRVRNFQIFIETAMQANSHPLRMDLRWGSPKEAPSAREDRNYGFELIHYCQRLVLIIWCVWVISPANIYLWNEFKEKKVVNPFSVMEGWLQCSAPGTNKDGYFYVTSRVLSYWTGSHYWRTHLWINFSPEEWKCLKVTG